MERWLKNMSSQLAIFAQTQTYAGDIYVPRGGGRAHIYVYRPAPASYIISVDQQSSPSTYIQTETVRSLRKAR